ncbi:hypothetical protein Tsubulata_012631 [Turnera subulata]|uniref:Major facilitator superfamily (MFS) profile domain-containing protein n=1 Tax=Turnera subulata TaxID=218843 RepID=A0A9Q0J990_9ROSI|nr:hypothetical protein Tsubulata_012631 [Turnera subulata]
MEGDQTSSPLLVKEWPKVHDGDGVGGGEGQNGGGSAATAVVVISTLVAVSGSYVFGTATGFSSPTQSAIMDDLSLSVAEFSLFGSILTIGAMVGAIMSGKVADYIGRRGRLIILYMALNQAMGFAEIFCVMGWIAVAFSKVAWLLDLGRLSLGYGIGLISYVVPVYIAEITPKNLRGGFTTVHQLMICLGVSLTFVIGCFVSWRVLAWIGLIPCLVQIIGLFFIPESPRWLAKIGRGGESEAALQRLRGENVNISNEAAEIRDYTETLQQHSEGSILSLFQWKYAHSLIVGVGLMALRQFGGVSGIAFYATSIFLSAGFSGRVGTIAMVFVQVPMTVLGTVLMDISGRRPLLMISAAGTCLGCFLAALSFFLQGLETLTDISPFFALSGVLVFPINMKGSAGSAVTLINWLGSWIISYAFNFLMTWSSTGTFFIFSSTCGITVLFVAKLVPETKGRTLEEIQASMNPIVKQ